MAGNKSIGPSHEIVVLENGKPPRHLGRTGTIDPAALQKELAALPVGSKVLAIPPVDLFAPIVPPQFTADEWGPSPPSLVDMDLLTRIMMPSRSSASCWWGDVDVDVEPAPRLFDDPGDWLELIAFDVERDEASDDQTRTGDDEDQRSQDIRRDEVP